MAVKITHILADGTVLDDITGHLVTRESCPQAYAVIDRINERLEREFYEQKRNSKQS